jgi:uncharacterized DUF497 family protein
LNNSLGTYRFTGEKASEYPGCETLDMYISNIYNMNVTMNWLKQVTGFQWDEGNLDKNLIKHGVENWECEQIFFNEPLIIVEDLKHSHMEDRWAVFGKTNMDRKLTVIMTLRGTLIRVISARDMSQKERKYHEKNS